MGSYIRRIFHLNCVFHCEADFIIYLYAKLNPRLGLTYLSFRIPKLGFSPHYLSSSRRLFLQPLPPSLSPLSPFLPAFSSPCFAFSSPLLSSSFPFLDMQPVMQSLLLLWRGCGCENGGLRLQNHRRRQNGEGWDNGDDDDELEGGIQKKNWMGQVWDSRRRRKQQEEEERGKKSQVWGAKN